MNKDPEDKELDDDLATDDETAEQVIGGLKKAPEAARPERFRSAKP
jgi:hypothetical protein